MEPSQLTYPFSARESEDLFGHPQCAILSDLRDLRVDFDQVDGVSADVMRAVEQSAFSTLATPGTVAGTPIVPVSIGNAGIEERSGTTSATTAGTAGTSTTPSGTPESVQGTATNVARDLAESGGIFFAIAGAIVVLLLSVGWFAVRRLPSGKQQRRQSNWDGSNDSGETFGPISADQTSVRHDQNGNHTVDATAERPGMSLISDQPMRAAANAADASAKRVTRENEQAVELVVKRDAAPIEVTCFGGPRVVSGDRVLWPSREFGQEGKSVELLLFLAASVPEGVDRDAIGAALWPEIDLADVASSLRQLRRRLRLLVTRSVPGLPEDAPFQRDPGRVYRLDPEVVGSDVHRFVEISRRARSSNGDEAIALFEHARALHNGDLFDSPAAPPFAWAIDPGTDGTNLRQQYRQVLLEDTRTLGNLYVNRPGGERIVQGIELYEALLRADPQDERVSRAVLRAHAMRRDHTGLEREWRRLCQALRSADADAGDIKGDYEPDDDDDEEASLRVDLGDLHGTRCRVAARRGAPFKAREKYG